MHRISKDIAYFYTKYVPPDKTSNNHVITRLVLSNKDRRFIDFSQGNYLNELNSKSNLRRYDVLEAEIKDNLYDFYNNVQMSEQITRFRYIPDKYKKKFEKEKEKALQNTINAALKELNNCIIRGQPPLSVMQSVNFTLDKRLISLEKFIEASCRQLNQYMILWKYQDMGYDKYLYITEGSSCDVCENLNGEVFNIDDAEVGVNLQPMHPNCDCATGILDKYGNIVALLNNKKDEEVSREKDNKFLNNIQTALDIAGLVPGYGEVADGMNAVIYALRGDYINAGLSGSAMIPFAGWFSTGGKLTGKALKIVNKVDDVEKFTKKLAKEVIENTGKAKPIQLHHFLTNKSSKYTGQFEKITKKYGLDLNGNWNKSTLPHQGRHPNAYHDYILNGIRRIDEIAKGNKNKFLKLFESIKDEVLNNPDMVTKKFWE